MSYFSFEDDAAEIADLVASASDEIDKMLFPHVCDIYKPAPVSIGVDKELSDLVYEVSVLGQKCLLDVLPETDSPTEFGRSKVDNMFTLDVFNFPSGVDVRDTYFIVFKHPGDNYNGFWIVQGNTQSMNYDPLRPVTQQKIIAVQTETAPVGVTVGD